MKIPLALSAPCAASLGASAAAGGAQVLNDDVHFPEGPVWYHGKLYYVEYDRNTVTVWDGTKNAIFWSEKGCGPSAVSPTAHGDLVITCMTTARSAVFLPEGKTLPPYDMTRMAIDS